MYIIHYIYNGFWVMQIVGGPNIFIVYLRSFVLLKTHRQAESKMYQKEKRRSKKRIRAKVSLRKKPRFEKNSCDKKARHRSNLQELIEALEEKRAPWKRKIQCVGGTKMYENYKRINPNPFIRSNSFFSGLFTNLLKTKQRINLFKIQILKSF